MENELELTENEIVETGDNSINVLGKRYLPQKDMANTFTFEQYAIAKPIIKQLFQSLPQDLINPVEGAVPENVNLKLMDALLSWSNDLEILALIYWDEKETSFSKKNYEQRKVEFQKLQMKDFEKAGEAIKDFFTISMKFIGANSITYFQSAV